MHHLNDSTFLGLVAQTLPRGEARRAILHLFTCSRCENRLLELYPSSGRLLLEYLLDEPAERVESALERTRSALVKSDVWLLREAERAVDLFEELRPLSPSHRRLRALNSSRFASLGLVARLLEESQGNCHSDPDVAKSWAWLACELVTRVAADVVPREIRADVESRAWRYLGHSLRILGDYTSSDESFIRAERLLSCGTGDVIERAEQEAFRMILMQDQGRFDEGTAHGWQAHRFYWQTGRIRAIARVEVMLAKHLLRGGRAQQAQEILESFFERFNRGTTGGQLYDVATQNYALSLVAIGNTVSAATILRRLQETMTDNSPPLIKARLDWAEGLVAGRAGRIAVAERILRRVRQAVWHLPGDRAHADLDLAHVLFQMNRCQEAVQLARASEQAFKGLGVNWAAQRAAELALSCERRGPPEAADPFKIQS